MALNFTRFAMTAAELLETPIGEAFVSGLVGLAPSPSVAKARGKPLLGSTESYSGTDPVSVSAFPSTRIVQNSNKSTVIEVVRRSDYLDDFTRRDWDQIRELGNEILQELINYSQGTYSSKDLRKAGHPYGWQRSAVGRSALGRKVPRRLGDASIGHVKGVRGSVPTMSVINRQSGKFAESWQFRIKKVDDGYILQFANTAKTDKGAPYPWFLAHGTTRMQPHGPWTEVPSRYMSRIDSVHQKAVQQAYQRYRAMTEMQEIFTSS